MVGVLTNHLPRYQRLVFDWRRSLGNEISCYYRPCVSTTSPTLSTLIFGRWHNRPPSCAHCMANVVRQMIFFDRAIIWIKVYRRHSSDDLQLYLACIDYAAVDVCSAGESNAWRSLSEPMVHFPLSRIIVHNRFPQPTGTTKWTIRERFIGHSLQPFDSHAPSSRASKKSHNKVKVLAKKIRRPTC